ncbi:MAG: DUF2281 domain-containing protein [Candidatus Binatia bacterium]
MNIADRIHSQVQSLPEPVQREVLDFVEYLGHKLRQEDRQWSLLSLTSALRGLEEDVWPEYTAADLREKWA